MMRATFPVLLCAAGLTLPLAAMEPPAAPEAPKAEPAVLVGAVTREQIEAAVPEWVKAEVAATPDAGTAQALAGVPAGAEVTVFLGTWCGDSRREVPRLWRAFDAAGGELPFAVRYVAVDRGKKEPAAAVTAAGVLFVPTFIVSRDGRELGRIVEQPLHGVERDLLDLLTGQAHGVLSLSHPSQPSQPGAPAATGDSLH